jgi:hypothetical protein
MSRHQTAGQNHNIKVNKSFENVATNQNCIHEETKEQVKLGECLLPFNLESFVFPAAI